jgi:hypothetical protein
LLAEAEHPGRDGLEQVLCHGRRNMNVSSIGQGPGSVVALLGPQTERAAAAVASSRGSKPDATVVRLAWFDLNGDGVIDSRSSLVGGDGTLIVPTHVSHPLFTHTVRRAGDRVLASREEPPTPEQPHAQTHEPVSASSVQTRQAIDAYQRYGQPTDDAPKARAVA